jgi:hypothetical protein
VTSWLPPPVIVTARGPAASHIPPTTAAPIVGRPALPVIVGRPALITKDDFVQKTGVGTSSTTAVGNTTGGNEEPLLPANVVQMVLNVISDASSGGAVAAGPSAAGALNNDKPRPLLWPGIPQRPPRPSGGGGNGFIEGANVIPEMQQQQQQQKPNNFLEGPDVIPEMQQRPAPEQEAGEENDSEDYLEHYVDLLPDFTIEVKPEVTVKPRPPINVKPGDFLEGPGIIPEMQLNNNNNFLEGPEVIPEMQFNNNNNFLEGPEVIPEMQMNSNNNFLEGPDVIPEMASTTSVPLTPTTMMMSSTTTRRTTTTTLTAVVTTTSPPVVWTGRPTYKPTVRPDIGFRPPVSPAPTRPPDGPTTTSKYRPTIQPAIMATYGPTISFMSTKVRHMRDSKTQLWANLEFFGPQMALAYRLDAISHGPKNSQFPGPNPLPLALVMDMHASKTLCMGLYKS